MKKIIEVKRDYAVTSLCQVCFTISQNVDIYELNLGFENNGIKNKRSIKICSHCLKELKEKLEDV
ncbi:MAG: hypothetical protein JW924_03570 [Fusobacteriaceae bacterium]|jgi:hypothetical protein|nr:hypothetical protein [Fusobacteriaceae bacterium]